MFYFECGEDYGLFDSGYYDSASDVSLDESLTPDSVLVATVDLEHEYRKVIVDGWTVLFLLECDYVCWVYEFTATRGQHVVSGSICDGVHATSRRALDQFLSSCPMNRHNPCDI